MNLNFLRRTSTLTWFWTKKILGEAQWKKNTLYIYFFFRWGRKIDWVPETPQEGTERKDSDQVENVERRVQQIEKLLENCSLRREEAKEPTKANQSIWKCEEAIFLKPRNNKNRGKLANYNSTELQNADFQKA